MPGNIHELAIPIGTCYGLAVVSNKDYAKSLCAVEDIAFAFEVRSNNLASWTRLKCVSTEVSTSS